MHMNTKKLTGIAACVALMAVCSWISIPFAIPFTMQTFAVFVTIGLLGGRSATVAIGIYILMGAVGLPVFAGFSGGVGILFGNTGGSIIGFLFSALTMWLTEPIWKKNTGRFMLFEGLGMLVCYFFGTLWFMFLYTSNVGFGGFISVMSMCVVPFIIPDAAKLVLAAVISRRVAKLLKLDREHAL